jgi:nicotinamide mononucleotide (NMN) deamidase PncC
MSGLNVDALLPRAERAVKLLSARRQMIVVAESSAGGLINAALLAVPGASACCRGGLVVYTYELRRVLLGISDEDMKGITPSTEAYVLLKARRARERAVTLETGSADRVANMHAFAAAAIDLLIATVAAQPAVTT